MPILLAICSIIRERGIVILSTIYEPWECFGEKKPRPEEKSPGPGQKKEGVGLIQGECLNSAQFLIESNWA
jgi:hypothetical protein